MIILFDVGLFLLIVSVICIGLGYTVISNLTSIVWGISALIAFLEAAMFWFVE